MYFLICTGNPLGKLPDAFFNALLQCTLAPIDLSGQAHQKKIKLGIVNQIVPAFIQLPIDIAQKVTDLINGHGFSKQIDGENAAEMIQGIFFSLGVGEIFSAHPVLNHIGLQPGDGRDLAQTDVPGQKKSVEYVPNLLRVLRLCGEDGSRYCPLHVGCSFLFLLYPDYNT